MSLVEKSEDRRSEGPRRGSRIRRRRTSLGPSEQLTQKSRLSCTRRSDNRERFSGSSESITGGIREMVRDVGDRLGWKRVTCLSMSEWTTFFSPKPNVPPDFKRQLTLSHVTVYPWGTSEADSLDAMFVAIAVSTVMRRVSSASAPAADLPALASAYLLLL